MLFCVHIVDAIHLLSVYAVWMRGPRPLQLRVSFLVIFDKRHMVLCFSTSTLPASFALYADHLRVCQLHPCSLWKIFRFHISVTSNDPRTSRFRHAADHCCHHGLIPWGPANGMQELDCKHMHPSLSGDFSSIMRNHAADGRIHRKHNYTQGGPSCFIVINNNDSGTSWSSLSAQPCLFEPMPLVHHLL